MFPKAVTWFLLLNLLNTLFFAEVPTRHFPSEKARVSAAGEGSVIDSLVEFLGYWLTGTALMPEEDFDDTPDHIKGNNFLEFLLLPLPSPLTPIFVVFTRSYASFQEPLSSLSFDVFSPPPQA